MNPDRPINNGGARTQLFHLFVSVLIFAASLWNFCSDWIRAVHPLAPPIKTNAALIRQRMDSAKHSDSAKQQQPQHHHQQQQAQQQQQQQYVSSKTATTNLPSYFRILYIVTSIHAVESGIRMTKKGSDRFANTLLPVLRESAHSMSSLGHVDVVLITHYNLTARHKQLLHEALPPNIPLQVWPDATPRAYQRSYAKRGKPKPEPQYLEYHTRGLSRQHRFVIKDKFQHYDMFVVMEDDMLVRAEHVHQYWTVTQQLYQLRQRAPRQSTTEGHRLNHFYGNMTRGMLQRTVPGLFRVEAALPGWNRSKMTHYQQNLYPHIPVDLHDTHQQTLDPSVCCHVSNQTANYHIPLAPAITDLYFWETSLDALGIRRMPDDDLGWALLLVGGLDNVELINDHSIGDFWVGRAVVQHANGTIQPFFDEPRPDTLKGRYANNQGGWMATRRQVFEWHTQNCHRGFLPPFANDKVAGEQAPKNPNRLSGAFDYDGLGLHSVEFWSGGQQLFGPLGCNLRRIIPLEPKQFSRHLIYHSSNNKQRQGNVLHRYSSRNILGFWGQLNAVRKQAEIIMQKQQTNQLAQKTQI